ncbi:hypothetical protein [Corynebacterium matruchotii]|nr:hypothetical protein [Corynebacterium matruchotii]
MDNSSIEEMAVHYFKGLFFKVGLLKTIFTEGDKTPLVDGSISIYQDGNKKNEDLVGTIPVQIKGTTRAISTRTPTFPLTKNDLEGLKSHGVLLLVAALKPDEENHKGYYAHLFRFQIEDLFKDMKPGQKQKSIPLKELPHDPEELLRVCYQAKDIQEKSTRPITISPEEFSNPQKISFTFYESPVSDIFTRPTRIGPRLGKDDINAVIELTNVNGTKIPTNANILLSPKEYVYQPTGHFINSGEITFQDSQHRLLSENQLEIAVSPGLKLIINRGNPECEVKLRIQDTLYDAYRDLEFLKSWSDSGVIYHDNQVLLKAKIPLKKIPYFEDRYQVFSDLHKLFEILKINSRLIQIEDLTEETLEKLEGLVKIFVYKMKPSIQSDPKGLRYKVMIGDDHLHFIFTYDSDTDAWNCFSLTAAPILLRIPDNEISKANLITAYDLLTKDKTLRRTLNLHPENFIVSYKKILDRTPDTEKQSFRNIATGTVIELITGADLNPLRRRELLSMAKELNEWLLSYEPENSIFLINQWQILHRNGLLTPELEKKVRALKRSLSNKDIHREIACAILLGQVEETQYLMEQLPQEGHEIKSWPIYYLFEHQETYKIPDLNKNPAWPAFLDSALREEKQ